MIRPAHRIMHIQRSGVGPDLFSVALPIVQNEHSPHPSLLIQPD